MSSCPRTVPWAVAGTLGALVLGVLGASELIHARSSRRRLGVPRGTPPGREAVVVLGYRNEGERINAVNRFRVRAALRTLDPAAGESVLVCCGGAVGGPVPEAELLARHARALGYEGEFLLEAESASTWENVQNAIPLIEDADSIAIVSNPLHAEKARAYLALARPDLAARLRRAEEYRPGELLWLKPLATVLGLGDLARLPH